MEEVLPSETMRHDGAMTNMMLATTTELPDVRILFQHDETWL